MRQGYTSYLATTLDYRESAPIAQSILIGLVRRHKAGDKSASAAIIKGHYHLVAAIVGSSARSEQRAEFAMSAALYGLVLAVENARTQLRDDNITAYITSYVKFIIKEDRACDHTVRAASRTVRRKIAKGKKFADIVPGATAQIHEDIERNDHGRNEVISLNHGSAQLPYAIPIAKPTDTSFEFKEALERAAQTPMEQAILKFKLEGYTYEEIGQKCGYSKSRVEQIVNPIIERFEAAYYR